MPRILSQDHLISMKDAQKIILSSFQYRPKSRTISIKDAKGKILAEPVRSQRTMPPVPLAGPDGIAVKSNDTQGASPENPLKIDGIKVNTGLPMPVGYDAVIPIEEVKVAENGRYQIINSVLPFQNMVTQGKDVVEGQEIIQSGHYLIPYDIAALSNYGITHGYTWTGCAGSEYCRRNPGKNYGVGSQRSSGLCTTTGEINRHS